MAGDVAVEIPEVCVACADGLEERPIDDVGGRRVGPVEAKLDRGDVGRETGDLHEPVFDRARALGAAPFLRVGLAQLEHGETRGEEDDGREAPQVDLVRRLVSPERKVHGHRARVGAQARVDAWIRVD